MANGEMIAKTVARSMIKDYQTENPNAIKAHRFDKNLIQDLLNEASTDGLRIYHGLDEDEKHVLVLVCIDSNGDDLENNYILERSTICPPICDSNSYFTT